MAKNWNKIDRDRIERASRIYNTNRDAGIALGIAANSFARACRQLGIEQPGARIKRKQAEAQARRTAP